MSTHTRCSSFMRLQSSILIQNCARCDGGAPVVAYVGKLFPKPDASGFEAFTRIFSGTIKVGDKVRELAPNGTFRYIFMSMFDAQMDASSIV